MDVYVIDTETYYDKTYSLSSLTTEEYINDPRFELIGLSVKKNECTAEWYSGADAAGFLKGFDFSNSMVVCHNTMFDAAILDWKYGVKPKVWADTMSMARFVHGVHQSASLASLAKLYGVGEKGTEVINALGKRRQDFSKEELSRYGDYCVNDTELTYEIFSKMMKHGFPMKELKIIDMTLRMFVEPTLEIDTAVLLNRLDDIRIQKHAMLKSLQEELDVTTNEEVQTILASNKKFAELLVQRGIEVPMKVSPTTGKNIPALGKKDTGFIELQETDDPFIQLLCSVRLGTKSTMEEARIERFLDIAKRNEGKLPIPLNYCGAHTSRWGGKEQINLQNLPSRDPKKKALKNSIVAPPGYVVIDCDSSQIEARVVAWLAGQEDILDAFRNKEDVYRRMGSRIYLIPPECIDAEQRFISKVVVLGAGFGVGWRKLQSELKAAGVNLSDGECSKIIRAYQDSNKMIVKLWRQAKAALTSMINAEDYKIGVQNCMKFHHDGFILPSGYKILYPNMGFEEEDGNQSFHYVGRKGKTYLWSGSVVENIVQGLARCVISDQMLLIAKRYRPVLTVHDAVAIVVPQDEKDEAIKFIEECMSTVPVWAQGLPVACESGHGYSYGDC
jgi:DNA polymerase